METTDRKLIKFSNYSLCITLPKSVIRELKWEKGDIVRLEIDSKKGEILIRKGLRVPKEKEIEKPVGKIPHSEKSNKQKKARW